MHCRSSRICVAWLVTESKVGVGPSGRKAARATEEAVNVKKNGIEWVMLNILDAGT